MQYGTVSEIGDKGGQWQNGSGDISQELRSYLATAHWACTVLVSCNYRQDVVCEFKLWQGGIISKGIL